MPDNVQIWMVVAFVGVLLAAVIWAGVRSFCGDPSTTYQPDPLPPSLTEPTAPIHPATPAMITESQPINRVQIEFGQIFWPVFWAQIMVGVVGAVVLEILKAIH